MHLCITTHSNSGKEEKKKNTKRPKPAKQLKYADKGYSKSTVTDLSKPTPGLFASSLGSLSASQSVREGGLRQSRVSVPTTV